MSDKFIDLMLATMGHLMMAKTLGCKPEELIMQEVSSHGPNRPR